MLVHRALLPRSLQEKIPNTKVIQVNHFFIYSFKKEAGEALVILIFQP